MAEAMIVGQLLYGTGQCIGGGHAGEQRGRWAAIRHAVVVLGKDGLACGQCHIQFERQDPRRLAFTAKYAQADIGTRQLIGQHACRLPATQPGYMRQLIQQWGDTFGILSVAYQYKLQIIPPTERGNGLCDHACALQRNERPNEQHAEPFVVFLPGGDSTGQCSWINGQWQRVDPLTWYAVEVAQMLRVGLGIDNDVLCGA